MVHATAEIGTPELTQMLVTVPDETEETIREILMDNMRRPYPTLCRVSAS